MCKKRPIFRLSEFQEQPFFFLGFLSCNLQLRKPKNGLLLTHLFYLFFSSSSQHDMYTPTHPPSSFLLFTSSQRPLSRYYSYTY